MTPVAFVPLEWRLLAWSGVDVFWFICLGMVAYRVWRGWRVGFARESAALIGLLAGWIIGLTQGPAMFARLWPGARLPAFILVPLASMILGLVVYVIAILVGRALFKRACDHPIGPTRLFLGVGGAVVGVFVGLFGVWILIVIVRLFGSAIEAPRETDRHRAPPSAGRRTEVAESDESVIVRIQHSVESGLVGDLVRFTDPFPQETYSDLHKVVVIAQDPVLQQKLLDAPSLHDLSMDPKVVALRQDPAAMEALQRHDYLSLLSNRHFLAVINDPRLSQRFEKIDVTRVLNETVH
jgi:hypothetical protein